MNKDQIAVSLMCMDFLKIKEQLEVLNESVGMLSMMLQRMSREISKQELKKSRRSLRTQRL